MNLSALIPFSDGGCTHYFARRWPGRGPLYMARRLFRSEATYPQNRGMARAVVSPGGRRMATTDWQKAREVRKARQRQEVRS